MKQRNSLALILKNGIELSSSGTTGPPKQIYQSPTKLKNANKVARECQKISSKSKIYTVCKMEHAGGLLAQTLPCLLYTSPSPRDKRQSRMPSSA